MISLSKMQEWFVNETENSVKKVRGEISKRIDAVKIAMDDLLTASKDFEIGETIDAETRSSQNIYEKMTEMVQEFTYPEKITYKTTEDFLKELNKFLERVLTLGRRFIPNLKRKYRTRVFILNRALERIQRNYTDLKGFLEDKSSLLKEVDATSDMIQQINDKIKERNNLKENIANESKIEDNLEKEIQKLEDNSLSLESKSVLREYDEIKKEIEVLGNKLRFELSGFDKPMRKLTSRAQDGKVMVPPELINIANQLRDNPLEALWGSEPGYPKFKDLMEIIIDAVKKDKIQLKGSMANKTISLAEEVIKGSLNELHSELLNLKEKQKILENKIEEMGLKNQIQELHEKKDELAKNSDIRKRQIRALEENLELLNSEIASLAAETQRQIKRLTSQDIKINIKE